MKSAGTDHENEDEDVAGNEDDGFVFLFSNDNRSDVFYCRACGFRGFWQMFICIVSVGLQGDSIEIDLNVRSNTNWYLKD